jgi:hypothetical protein
VDHFNEQIEKQQNKLKLMVKDAIKNPLFEIDPSDAIVFQRNLGHPEMI